MGWALVRQKARVGRCGRWDRCGQRGILSWSGGSGEMKRLVSGGDAQDMGEVVDYLKANQIEYEFSESGNTILVPADKHASVKMEMAMKGLPKTGNVGYEIFDEGNFGISDFVQRTNKQRAIQGRVGANDPGHGCRQGCSCNDRSKRQQPFVKRGP